MSIDAIFSASRFGLEYERMRLEAASHNIAVANTPASATQGAPQLMRVTVGSFGHAVGIGNRAGQPMLVAYDGAERKVHDPSDPNADRSGMVRYSKVDLVQEMSTLVEATRAYEANVRAFNTMRGMALRALDIGSGA